MEQVFLGLDLGTSGCKLIAFNAGGSELARASRDYSLTSPGPGLFELDANFVWSQAIACFREINAVDRRWRVLTLSISVLGEAVIAVDRAGNPLAPAIVSADMRAKEELEEIADKIGAKRIYAITGQPLSPIHSLPKLRWWRKHRPDIFDQAWKFLCFGEFALMRLGLPLLIDQGMAARMMALDIEKQTWSTELLSLVGVPLEKLPSVALSGSEVGTIAANRAADLALPEGIRVILGGHDQPMGALGAGATTAGEAVYSIGTTETLVVPLPGPSNALESYNISCYPHVVPRQFVGLAGNQSGARVLSWLCSSVNAAQPLAVTDLFSLIPDEAPTWPIFLPHFLGSGSVLNNHDSVGALYGLTFDTRPHDIVLAVLEGITFEQAIGLEAMLEVGIPIDRIRAIGGGTRSDLWLQMKADILNRPIVQIDVRDAACLGGAILGCWVAYGRGPIADIANKMVRTTRTFRPRTERYAAHARRLAIYREVYAALSPLGSRLRSQWDEAANASAEGATT